MALSFEQKLQNYADLVVHVGLNIQPGQQLMIRTPLDAAPLVRKVAESAYKRGAAYVDVIWNDDALKLARFQYAARDSFEIFPNWQRQALLDGAARGDAVLSIYATDPDLLKDQDSDLVAQVERVLREQMAEYYGYVMRDAFPWCVIAVPVTSWAAKIFPKDTPERQIEKLWDAIFETTRLDQPNAVAAWEAHVKRLKTWSDYLNAKQYQALHYQGKGTDLTLGLPKNHIWKSGQSESEQGIPFIANMPTEEVFTLPHKDQAEGVVRASRPLNYGGTLIENFSLTFSEGKIMGVEAEKGEKVLKDLIAIDEGASHLGEVALVPNSSPISQSGLLFYNTLYDENAASHLAIGRAYRFSLAGGKTMSEEDFAAAGGNTSLTHVDFMIGHEAMDLDGIREDGIREALMRQGEWVVDFD